MPRLVKDRVKVDGIELPAGGDGRDIFVQPRNERYMAGTGLGGDARVRNAKGTLVEDFVANKGREVASFRGLVGIRMLLEAFVCTESVAWQS